MTADRDALWEKIASKLHGELSIEEEAEFTRTISDDANLLEFEKAKTIHDNLANSVPIPANGKVKSWVKVESEIKRNQMQWIKVVMKYAAIIVVALYAGSLMRPSSSADKEIRYSEISVPYGEMSQLKLSDGTRIWLNSGTTLRYPDKFAENCRSVTVVGEAYFEVSKISNKPFTVNSANLNVKVLGTSFNFSSYLEDVSNSVTLVEGKVSVQNREGLTIATLSPGEMVTKNKKENSLDIRKVETGFYAAWKEGKILFDDEPLDQIAVKLERWFNVEIVFADENLKSHRFTGTILKNKPVDQIMQALELLSPIKFTHQINATGKDKITIYKRT